MNITGDPPGTAGKRTSVPVQIAVLVPASRFASALGLASLVHDGAAALGSMLHRSIPEYPSVGVPVVASPCHWAQTSRRSPAHTDVIAQTCFAGGSGQGGRGRHWFIAGSYAAACRLVERTRASRPSH